jgi:hypothetical protein
MTEQDKPKCKLVGEDGNVFNLIALASRALKKEGQGGKAKEMQDRCFKSHNYDEVLSIICEYVDAY